MPHVVQKFLVLLLETCHQIHYEAALLAFRECNFEFSDEVNIPSFLKMLLRCQRRAIRNITLSLHSGPRGRPTVFDELSGLEQVVIFYNRIAPPELLLSQVRTSSASKLSIVSICTEDDPCRCFEPCCCCGNMRARRVEGHR